MLFAGCSASENSSAAVTDADVQNTDLHLSANVLKPLNRANYRTRLNKKKTLKNSVFSRASKGSGGEGGIRTLDELLTHTRVPVVRHKPG